MTELVRRMFKGESLDDVVLDVDKDNVLDLFDDTIMNTFNYNKSVVIEKLLNNMKSFDKGIINKVERTLLDVYENDELFERFSLETVIYCMDVNYDAKMAVFTMEVHDKDLVDKITWSIIKNYTEEEFNRAYKILFNNIMTFEHTLNLYGIQLLKDYATEGKMSNRVKLTRPDLATVLDDMKSMFWAEFKLTV